MTPLIQMNNIVKVYPNGVVANDGVNFSVDKGEIHALVGENGAGKTTLMKILYGLEHVTSGEILLDGKTLTLHSPHDAINRGIGMVHQNFMLIPSFTVAENIVLGEEPTQRGLIRKNEAIRITEELSTQYGLRVDATAVVESINVGMRQRIEILKTLYRGAEILILDEPTAVLTPQETKELFQAVRSLVEQGKTVIFITHKLREVMEISDNVTVMRSGKVVGEIPTSQATREGLASMMVGREVLMTIDKPPVTRGEPVLSVKNLSYVSGDTGRQVIKDMSFNVYAGEILGVAGVEGNGQTELVEVLTGLRSATRGSAHIDSIDIINKEPRTVRMAGISHIPEDRLTNGLALLASIEENLIVDRYFKPPFKRGMSIDRKMVTESADQYIREFDIRTINGKVLVSSLSGGNMQKVIVAREFSSSPELLIAAQPTRGIDVGATEFVRQQLVKKRTDGTAVLLVSADLSEVMSISDRIIVMYEGEITGVFTDVDALTEEEIGLFMLGLKHQDPKEMETVL
jgi:simple sugar transport system ATP-binding protein